MPAQRKPTRRALSGSFYDRRGAIADAPQSPRGGTAALEDDDGDSDDGGYTLTAYGEMSSEADMFHLPPSPTQTIKYRYRAYRPKAKLARLGGKSRAQAGGKTTSSAYHHNSELASLLGLSPYSRGSPKRDFQALMHKYRESADGWRDAAADSYLPSPSASPSPARKPALQRGGSGVFVPATHAPASPTPLRRTGSAARVGVLSQRG